MALQRLQWNLSLKNTKLREIILTFLFSDPDAVTKANHLNDTVIDGLDVGVIGFDQECLVRRYNTCESKAAGLAPERVLGKHFFSVVAQCMNNYMVAQRFEDAQLNGVVLDDIIDYVLTLRMRPTKVRMRLLSSPSSPTRYIFIQRLSDT